MPLLKYRKFSFTFTHRILTNLSEIKYEITLTMDQENYFWKMSQYYVLFYNSMKSLRVASVLIKKKCILYFFVSQFILGVLSFHISIIIGIISLVMKFLSCGHKPFMFILWKMFIRVFCSLLNFYLLLNYESLIFGVLIHYINII